MNCLIRILLIAFWPMTTIANTNNPFDLHKQCSMAGGTIVHEWVCPNSGSVRTSDFCVISDGQNNHMIFNGCSGSIGNYDKVFFQACVYHDFCYHHEPISHGLNKEDCDQNFLKDMVAICRSEQIGDSDCESTALWFYRAVKYFGQSAWNCSKEFANYPRSNDLFWSLFAGITKSEDLNF